MHEWHIIWKVVTTPGLTEKTLLTSKAIWSDLYCWPQTQSDLDPTADLRSNLIWIQLLTSEAVWSGSEAIWSGSMAIPSKWWTCHNPKIEHFWTEMTGVFKKEILFIYFFFWPVSQRGTLVIFSFPEHQSPSRMGSTLQWKKLEEQILSFKSWLGSTLQWKNLLLEEQILSCKS